VNDRLIEASGDHGSFIAARAPRGCKSATGPKSLLKKALA
jgi:hypothetical protein